MGVVKQTFGSKVIPDYQTYTGHMTDHAGGRRSVSVVNPGTKLWRPPVEVTQFWRPRSGFGARFRF